MPYQCFIQGQIDLAEDDNFDAMGAPILNEQTRSIYYLLWLGSATFAWE
jgi:hypothetical protein